MKPMDIKKFHSLCVNHTQRLFDRNQYIISMCFGLKPNGDVILLSKQFGDTEEKINTYNMYSVILLAEKVSMYCFMSEAWFYEEKVENDFDVKNHIPPSEHSDKKSGLFITTTDRADNQLFSMFAIDETKSQKILRDKYADAENLGGSDQVQLFKRTPQTIDSKIEDDVATLLELHRPAWYKTISKESFNNVKVDS